MVLPQPVWKSWILVFANPINNIYLSISTLIIFFQGDSGGPLTYRLGDQHILIGVVSRGTLLEAGWTCGVKTSVFCRVAHVRDWIDSKMYPVNPYDDICDRDTVCSCVKQNCKHCWSLCILCYEFNFKNLILRILF